MCWEVGVVTAFSLKTDRKELFFHGFCEIAAEKATGLVSSLTVAVYFCLACESLLYSLMYHLYKYKLMHNF